MGNDTDRREKVVHAFFYRSAQGNESVREWLLSLSDADCKIIGRDVAVVEFRWPVGMPLCRPMGRNGLYELRSHLAGKRISRVLFFVHEGQMILLHGFIKKSRKTPKADLDLALSRKREVEK